MDKQQQGQGVYIVGAARTDSVKYDPNNFLSLSDLLAVPVRQIPENVQHMVDTVYVIHRYPTPLSLDFDREKFLSQTALRKGEAIRIFRDDRAILGGMDVIKKVFTDLSRGDKSTVLIVGGEVFETGVWQRLKARQASEPAERAHDGERQQTSLFDPYQLQQRRFILNRFGGLPPAELELGLTPISANALVADAFFRANSLSPSEMDELMCCISSHVEKYAYMNPHAYQHHKEGGMDRVTPDKYRRVVKRERKWPFTLLDLCSISNGAGAVVFTNEPEEFIHKVEVAGCIINKQHANTSLLDRARIGQFDSNREAWRELKKTLDLDLRRRPPGQRPLMILELFDIYTFQIAMTLIEMGMYENVHEILRDFRAGYFDPAPDIFEAAKFHDVSLDCGVILNPSGGSKDGHANGGHALVKAAECFFQLTELRRGDASLSLPSKDLELALIQTLSGIGNTAGILALKKCPV